ncbi:uncharacterized protein LOC131144827 [Malania oleifera]|uniref:uncharacterized protein LOC131144827 n=1 Tax=Malania oleifera TaxID=397392 RepID=UPI0025AEA7A7|nr:uncharacterized protein LOC131144827 [Malania oleifera]
MTTSSSDDTPGALLVSKSFKHDSHPPAPFGSLSLHGGKFGSNSKSRATPDGTKCSHCGNTKHTRETCFKLPGYPDWWHDRLAQKRRNVVGNDEGTGKAAVAAAEPHISLIPADSSNSNSGGDTRRRVELVDI